MKSHEWIKSHESLDAYNVAVRGYIQDVMFNDCNFEDVTSKVLPK